MNKLQTMQSNNLPVIKLKKPMLAVLENKKKLKDYTEIEINTALANLIIHLLDLLAVKSGKRDHQIKLIEFIKSSNFSLTIEEIRHAFNLFVQGEFTTKPMQQLNAVVFGNVIRDYTAYKREKLRVYRQKKQMYENRKAIPSKQEQDKLLNDATTSLYLEYKNTGTITGVTSHIYDHLYKKGVLPPHTKEFKSMILKKARVIAKSEEMTKASKSIEMHRNLKTAIKKIEDGSFNGLITISKRLVLLEYFKSSDNK